MTEKAISSSSQVNCVQAYFCLMSVTSERMDLVIESVDLAVLATLREM